MFIMKYGSNCTTEAKYAISDVTRVSYFVEWMLNLLLFLCRKSGEKEPLDLGLPISNLDGLRVVLEAADHIPGKGKMQTHTE